LAHTLGIQAQLADLAVHLQAAGAPVIHVEALGAHVIQDHQAGAFAAKTGELGHADDHPFGIVDIHVLAVLVRERQAQFAVHDLGLHTVDEFLVALDPQRVRFAHLDHQAHRAL
jgi:hypothetical protein